MKTRERILQASLSLFNEQGERQVTTNHIAAHLGISPGNLYYHFRNKEQIVAELFSRYETQIADSLALPAERSLVAEDKVHYLETLFEGIWDYRFLYRELEHLLISDPALSARFRPFAQRCIAQGSAIYQGLVDGGILCVERTDPQAMAINSWLLLTNWVSFVCSVVSSEPGQPLDQRLLRRGVHQVLALERGLLTPEAAVVVEQAMADFYQPLPGLD